MTPKAEALREALEDALGDDVPRIIRMIVEELGITEEIVERLKAECKCVGMLREWCEFCQSAVTFSTLLELASEVKHEE